MTRIFITTDYELFFGKSTGSPYPTLISPTNRLLEILDKYNIKSSYFIDCGYLLKLKDNMEQYPVLRSDFREISHQLTTISAAGHDMQLHIHPHWEDSFFDGKKWIIDTHRYRLHDFSAREINSIVHNYKSVLEEMTGRPVFAFRAGGWCIQPFDKLREALRENGIWLDSTVYHNGSNLSATHCFNFENSPEKTSWRFEDNPSKEQPNGSFLEMPIASLRVSPLFFWRLALTRKLGGTRHRPFGNGTPLPAAKRDIASMLTHPTNTVVSLDGIKAGLLQKALKAHQARYPEDNNFVIMGHPKALTEYSLQKLSEFLRRTVDSCRFLTFADLAKQSPYLGQSDS
jgi:hypothetical protein